MTFVAFLNCFLLWINKVGDQDVIVNFRMTFNASDILKMGSLVREPFMLLQDIYLLMIGKKPEMIVVGMAVQTDIVVVKNCFLNVF